MSLIAIAALIGFLAFVATIAICCFYSNYKRQLRKHQPVKIIEAPVRAYFPASLPPGSQHGGVHGHGKKYLETFLVFCFQNCSDLL